MPTIFELITQMPNEQWNYYHGIDHDYNPKKPFVEYSVVRPFEC